MKKYILLFVSLVSLLALYFSYETKIVKLDVKKELKSIATKPYLEEKIIASINTENTDDLNMYLNIVDFLNIKLSDNIKIKIKEYNSILNTSLRNTKDFSKSFITGKSENSIGFAGSLASDLTLVGDIRDISKEGKKLVKGEKYDEFILGISVIGLGLSISQVFTAGSTTALKIGASTLKFAKKSGRITKSFAKIISSKLSKSMDFKLLKKLDFTNFSRLRKSFSSFSKTINFTHTSKLFEKINRLRKNTSSFDSISLLKYIDKEKDLTKIVKLSNKFGKNTKGIVKILGKKIFKAGKVTIKYTSLFIFELMSFIISSVLFVLSFFVKISFFKRLRHISNLLRF